MCQIYEHAVCTIAANVSERIQGLFSHSSGDWASYRRKNSRLHDEAHNMSWINLIKEGPLNRRAWCLQERYSSRRILSVHDSDAWIWECDSCTGLGEGYFTENPSDAYRQHRLRTLSKTPCRPRPWIFTRTENDLLSQTDVQKVIDVRQARKHANLQ